MTRVWGGKWTPLRLDTVSAVVAEVNDFVHIFTELKKAIDDGVVPTDGLGPTERRMTMMLRSAQLRLDIMTHFYDAHKRDKRSERIKIGVRNLRNLLQQQGVEEDQFSPEVAFGPNSMSIRDESPSVTTPRRSPKRSRSIDHTKDLDSSKADDSFSPLKLKQEELLRARTLAKDGEISNLNNLASELSSKISGLEQENLKLERSMLEMVEGRERMKYIVEEQVYTVSLMTKVSGLLHFEMRRILFKTVARGILFWGLSGVVLLHTIVTGGVHAISLYMLLRGQFDESLGIWSMLVVDVIAVSVILGLLHEWILFAEYDINHGSVHWLVESVLMRRDDSTEAARTAARRYTEHTINASRIDLSTYQRTSTFRKETLPVHRGEPSSVAGSVPSSPATRPKVKEVRLPPPL